MLSQIYAGYVIMPRHLPEVCPFTTNNRPSAFITSYAHFPGSSSFHLTDDRRPLLFPPPRGGIPASWLAEYLRCASVAAARRRRSSSWTRGVDVDVDDDEAFCEAEVLLARPLSTSSARPQYVMLAMQ